MKFEYKGNITEVLKNKDHREIIQIMKTGEGVDLLKKLGEYSLAEELKKHKWKNTQEDTLLLSKILNALNMKKTIKVELQGGKAEELINVYSLDEKVKKGSFTIINRSASIFDFHVHSIECDSKNVTLSTKKKGEQLRINYTIRLKDYQDLSKEHIAKIMVYTNYKTFQYLLKIRFRILGEKKINSLQDLYRLYLEDNKEALEVFKDGDALRRSLTSVQQRIYRSINGLQQKDEIKLQNLLHLWGYDVEPQLDFEINRDGLFLKNTGKGLLYGRLITDIYGGHHEFDWDEDQQWSLERGRIRNWKGKIKISSNGGSQLIELEDLLRAMDHQVESVEELPTSEIPSTEVATPKKEIEEAPTQQEEKGVLVSKTYWKYIAAAMGILVLLYFMTR